MSVPANTEENCPACDKPVLRRELVKNRYVCPLCGYHHPIGAYYRLSLILDEGSFKEMDEDLVSGDPLDFPGYEAKLDNTRRRTGLGEGVVTAIGRIEGQKVAAGVPGQPLLYGQHERCPGREGHPSGGVRRQEQAPPDPVFRQRRRPHAGGGSSR